ncbi:MAG: sigma-70 family RNA polymerase sigma factor [Muribaculaceae bacterium]|nr:sigma-70 family RNA polymerase sigma factor [Muribaculaceae bacterium]
MEEKEFRQRVIPLQRLMYSLALKLGLPPADAADAVQEAQLNLWRSREKIPASDRESRAYSMAAVRNECIQWYRRRRPTEPIETVNETVIGSSPGNEAEERDTRRYVEKAIEKLPSGQREVIRLSGLGGLAAEEISEATGISPANVRQLLSRGRRKLRDIFIKEETPI